MLKTLRNLTGAFVALGAGLAGCSSDSTGGSEPTSLAILAQPPAQAQSGIPLSQQPVIQIQNVSGAAVSQRGVLVTVSLATGSGTLSGTIGVRTDDDGKASFTDLGIAGAPGARALRFSAPGLSSAVSTSVDLSPGPAAIIASKEGNNQTAPAGSVVPVTPKVLVTDATGNPVPGVAVTFTTVGGGAVQGGDVVTNASGIAAVGAWTLGSTPGSYSLTANGTGLQGSPVSFTATATVGAPSSLTLTGGADQTAVAGTPVAVPPSVLVADAAGNPIAGIVVVFAVTAGGGSVTGASAITNAAGVATVGSWILGPDPGANSLSVTRAGVPPLTVSATASPVPVAIITGDNQRGVVGSELSIPVFAQVRRGGFPQVGVTVTFAVTTGGGSFDSVAVVTDGSGIASSRWTLGLGTGIQTATASADQHTPATITATAIAFTQVVTGRVHACGLDTDGLAYCWGDNQFGQVGDGTFTDRLRPVPVTGGLVFASLAAAGNGNFTCGLASDGAAHCWGSNNHGQLGDGTGQGVGGPLGNARPAPVAVIGDLLFANISLGGDHACGVTTGNLSFCWGRNFSGEVGDGSVQDRLAPTAVSTGLTFTTISTGDRHSCGLTAGGAAHCWGFNGNTRLGSGSAVPTQTSTPLPVAGGLSFSQISAGEIGTCALSGGVAYCWGGGTSGQIGDGTFSTRGVPTLVSGGLTFASLSSAGSTPCARQADGTTYCWGRNGNGEAGTGVLGNLNVPTAVAGGFDFGMVASSLESTCALTTPLGAIYCWGSNNNGQVGDGTRILRATPTQSKF